MVDYPMHPGTPVYLRYIGNIRHYNRELFTAPVSWVGATAFIVAINGHTARFDRATLRHDNRGHRPSYQLFLSIADYEQQVEVEELRRLMSRTDFTRLPVDKQRAIRAILEA